MNKEKISCLKCHHLCDDTTIYCPECGENMRDLPELTGQDPSGTKVLPSQSAELGLQLRHRRAYFPRKAELLLYIPSTNQHIPCDFDRYLTVGRDKSQHSDESLDLSPYNAAAQGVSRRHARFYRTQLSVMVEDLGALNGTFLNGEKLSSGRTYVFCDGDELRLGAMTMTVVFKQNAE